MRVAGWLRGTAKLGMVPSKSSVDAFLGDLLDRNDLGLETSASDGCWHRAERISSLAHRRGWVCSKIWALSPLLLETGMELLNPDFSDTQDGQTRWSAGWKLHVAITVLVRAGVSDCGVPQGETVIVDPSLFRRGVSPVTWFRQMRTPGACIAQTGEECFKPLSLIRFTHRQAVYVDFWEIDEYDRNTAARLGPIQR